MHELFKIHI